MHLTRELLLTYQGHRSDGLCHIRIYEQPGQLPVVIAGELDDAPGPSITNAIETVAAAIQQTLFSDGREFRLIEYHPDTVDLRGEPIYSLIEFTHRSTHRHYPDDLDNPTHPPSLSAASRSLSPEVRHSSVTSANRTGSESLTSKPTSAVV